MSTPTFPHRVTDSNSRLMLYNNSITAESMKLENHNLDQDLIYRVVGGWWQKLVSYKSVSATANDYIKQTPLPWLALTQLLIVLLYSTDDRSVQGGVYRQRCTPNQSAEHNKLVKSWQMTTWGDYKARQIPRRNAWDLNKKVVDMPRFVLLCNYLAFYY